MSNEKQTAVQWLIEQIECRGLVTKELRKEFKVALQMEWDQKIEEFEVGRDVQRMINNNNNE
jgi:hypothetical protein